MNNLIKTLKQICVLTQEELKELLYEKLISYYKNENVKYYDGGLIALGDMKITLLAHMDIYNSEPSSTIIEEEGIIRGLLDGEPHILSGDDRCGVAIILQLLEDGYRPNIIFTEDEETGSEGIIKIKENNFEDLQEIGERSLFLLQLDRKGSVDYVTYDCYNDDLDEYMESFDLINAIGSSTDIRHISEPLNIASVNISVGYHNNHSAREYVVIDEFQNAYFTTKKILNNLPLEKFTFSNW